MFQKCMDENYAQNDNISSDFYEIWIKLLGFMAIGKFNFKLVVRYTNLIIISQMELNSAIKLLGLLLLCFNFAQSICGDEVVDAGEQCDAIPPGCDRCKVDMGYSCTSAIGSYSVCRPTCGDSILQSKTYCDGTRKNGQICRIATDEECDNGMKEGCTDCKVEIGYSCGNLFPNMVSSCGKIYCGDYTVQSMAYCDGTRRDDQICRTAINEQCDQGLITGRGCTADCKVDFGYKCTTLIGLLFSRCAPTCGNGLIETTAQCDGITRNNSTCRLAKNEQCDTNSPECIACKVITDCTKPENLYHNDCPLCRNSPFHPKCSTCSLQPSQRQCSEFCINSKEDFCKCEEEIYGEGSKKLENRSWGWSITLQTGGEIISGKLWKGTENNVITDLSKSVGTYSAYYNYNSVVVMLKVNPRVIISKVQIDIKGSDYETKSQPFSYKDEPRPWLAGTLHPLFLYPNISDNQLEIIIKLEGCQR